MSHEKKGEPMKTNNDIYDLAGSGNEAPPAVTSLVALRINAMNRYGKNNQPYLTVMAEKYGAPYCALSHVLNGRANLSYIIAALQSDFNLSDEQVLACWPLLRRWPRPDLEARAMRRAG